MLNLYTTRGTITRPKLDYESPKYYRGEISFNVQQRPSEETEKRAPFTLALLSHSSKFIATMKWLEAAILALLLVQIRTEDE